VQNEHGFSQFIKIFGRNLLQESALSRDVHIDEFRMDLAKMNAIRK
jgi:hypothetical protein